MSNETPSKTIETLAELVERAAGLHLILESARAQRDAGQKTIDATISDYVIVKNRISALVDKMIDAAASRGIANG